MYQLHDQHRQEIEDQRHHLAQLIEENQRARQKAEEELELARESLTKEKEACKLLLYTACMYIGYLSSSE